MKKVVQICNLDCANCAAKLERALNKIDGVNVALNFMAQKMTVEIADNRVESAVDEMKAVIKKVEPSCSVKGL